MKSIFDTAVQTEIQTRISSLSAQSTAQWGKMDISQMLQHCILCDDMYLGKLPVKRAFIGRLIGKSILKKILKDDSPFNKNSPTAPELKTEKDSGEIEARKQEWIARVNAYKQLNPNNFVHPFFGPMTKKQIGYMAYKHCDHHLMQFGA